MNNFKAFMEKIHNLYSQSNANSRELLDAAQEVGSQVLKIGKHAMGGQQLQLSRHFENAVGDQTRNDKENKLAKA